MPSITKIKGRYLFGTSSAASIVPQAGTGSLTYTAGTGGATFASNYVDLKQGSYFTTPFLSTPRDRTLIVVGMSGFYDRVFDGDATYRFPPTVLPMAPMTGTGGSILAWAAAGFLVVSGGPFWRAEASADLAAGTYDTVAGAIAYRDGSFTVMPSIMIVGHGPGGTYFGLQCGRELAWFSQSAAYAGAKQADQATWVGDPGGATANSHTPLLGFAEYSFLTKAEALEAATEMVVLLEARGWTGVFHNPVTSE